MNYFQTLGIIFGLMAFLKPFYMHILPWDENTFIKNTYTKERPRWIVYVAILGLALIALTWYMEIATDIQYSIIITIMFSLTAIKAIVFLFNYKKFYNWVAEMLKKDKEKKIILIDIYAGIFGLAMIILSLLFL